jgi:hypothetical protein
MCPKPTCLPAFLHTLSTAWNTLSPSLCVDLIPCSNNSSFIVKIVHVSSFIQLRVVYSHTTTTEPRATCHPYFRLLCLSILCINQVLTKCLLNQIVFNCPSASSILYLVHHPASSRHPVHTPWKALGPANSVDSLQRPSGIKPFPSSKPNITGKGMEVGKQRGCALLDGLEENKTSQRAECKSMGLPRQV